MHVFTSFVLFEGEKFHGGGRVWYFNVIWLKSIHTFTFIVTVMNLVATHSNCTSPIDYISHHALHSHIPVHHYTNHTAVTIHSLVLIVSPHLHLIHSHTYKQHTYTHPLRSLVFPWLSFLSVLPIHPTISVFHPGLPDLGSLNLCLWPRLLPGIVYVSALPLIFLFLPADLACLILPIKYCCKWIHSPLTIPYRRLRHTRIQQPFKSSFLRYGYKNIVCP